eukprot:3380641-Amphidinium_carterae.1
MSEPASSKQVRSMAMNACDLSACISLSTPARELVRSSKHALRRSEGPVEMRTNPGEFICLSCLQDSNTKRGAKQRCQCTHVLIRATVIPWG